MLFAIRLPRTEVTLMCCRRKQCRLSVKRRRCSQCSAGCANKDARLLPASVPVWRGFECLERAKGNYICERKKETGIKPSLLIFCCYSFGVSSSALAAAFGASASAAGASAFASASVAGAAAVSSSTTDCCTNCSFSSAVRI